MPTPRSMDEMIALLSQASTDGLAVPGAAEALGEYALAASDFRSAVCRGDTEWVYDERAGKRSKAQAASGRMVDAEIKLMQALDEARV